MVRFALILCSLAMTSTVWAHPFIYNCIERDHQITLQVAVASKDMISVSRFQNSKFIDLKVWNANGQTSETVEFLYPKKDIHIRASKDMMIRGNRRVTFVYDKPMAPYQCLRKY